MEGIVVRRVIPSDNSCLFNAVGYVMDHDKLKAPQLRQVIAATVASDPAKYSEAFLGKPNEEYCAWILDSDKWGGAIELSILAEHYGREIAAYDIQNTRCDLYGQEMRYSERVMLIYDGLHYDALAVTSIFCLLPSFLWLTLSPPLLFQLLQCSFQDTRNLVFLILVFCSFFFR
ncbi:OVARIAN TUMOR DOMAIN-containing deubiquitinating enzyme 2 isoform X2 [Cannabis sativa]|uniref:OVARIAN TUMOR DOMAIN-containing deubiquitinating enzyme 2 isoform X2 n=1 Tax=Cannabis sativa TaxID=3483 RepID=UPI0011E03A69|nr:OVARIAN TUMOR DOMAIN-containing deubiquitinating enzyme 2 isoform X2 [Cannabis sativa]